MGEASTSQSLSVSKDIEIKQQLISNNIRATPFHICCYNLRSWVPGKTSDVGIPVHRAQLLTTLFNPLWRELEKRRTNLKDKNRKSNKPQNKKQWQKQRQKKLPPPNSPPAKLQHHQQKPSPDLQILFHQSCTGLPPRCWPRRAWRCPYPHWPRESHHQWKQRFWLTSNPPSSLTVSNQLMNVCKSESVRWQNLGT